jgi:HlyD family secretion protein
MNPLVPSARSRAAKRCSGPGLTLACALLITGCVADYGTSASLGTLERDRIDLVAESDEPITRILVQEGDVVEVGEILIQQDTARAEVALARANADEAAARFALGEAEAGPRQQQISQGRARLEAAQSAVKTARLDLDRELALVEKQVTSQNRVDSLQGRYEEAVAREDEARAALDELLEGTRSETIDQARSRHAAALATVHDLEINLERASIRSPVDGIVESLPFELGERPPFGATVVVVLARGRTYARVHVSEPLRARLAPGAKAEIWLDGRDEPLSGTLRWIAAEAAFTPYFALNQHDRSRLSYLAEVDLDQDDDSLPIGIPVEVAFPGLAP